MNNFKYKYLTKEELIINIDRLSRFKLPEEAYIRVFTSIILKTMISPVYSKNDIENMSGSDISKLVEIIWNSSVKNIFGETYKNNNINLLKYLAESSFCNFDKKTLALINTNLNIAPVIEHINYEESPINLKFLYKNINKNNEDDILSTSKKNCLLFPIRKLVIAEGITEEILLPVFAKKLKHDFNAEGVYIYGAGGKSKSPSLYMRLKEKVKIPIILLFDSDAAEICDIMQKNLLHKDKIIIIKKGEFEDIISLNLIKRALNSEYEPATPVIKDDLHIYGKMCENIEHFYKIRHLGEFKKSKLSRIIAKNVKYDTDITEDIKNIINDIILLA